MPLRSENDVLIQTEIRRLHASVFQTTIPQPNSNPPHTPAQSPPEQEALRQREEPEELSPDDPILLELENAQLHFHALTARPESAERRRQNGVHEVVRPLFYTPANAPPRIAPSLEALEAFVSTSLMSSENEEMQEAFAEEMPGAWPQDGNPGEVGWAVRDMMDGAWARTGDCMGRSGFWRTLSVPSLGGFAVCIAYSCLFD